MRGFRRGDGLYEVEGHLTDRKPFDFIPSSGGDVVPAHTPVHDMSVRLVFDDQMIVREVHAFSASTPYAACPAAAPALQKLKGLPIAAGWSREVRSRLAGAQGCTHLVEIVVQLATAAYQSMTTVRANQPLAVDSEGRPLKIDSCYAYRTEGELVKLQWPRWHRPSDAR